MLRNTMYLGGGAVKIPVTITGTGHSTRCYAQANGVKYYTDGNRFEVQPNDIIIFGIYGKMTSRGFLYIDGVEILREVNSNETTYLWTVPDGTAIIEVELAYDGGSIITVTTS